MMSDNRCLVVVDRDDEEVVWMNGPAAPRRAARIERAALCARLDGALRVPLTVVVAPAGAGKTTLLAQWVMSRPSTVFVRLDIDALDDDPVRFAHRFLNAFSPVEPVPDDVRKLIALHTDGLGTALLDGLCAFLRTFPDCVVVLDDLHRMSNQTLLADIARLIDIVPTHIHTVVSSRTDPPFSWSKRRADDELLEIRQNDLALSFDEATRLLTEITGETYPAEQVESLVGRTEGWAAGLQLAAVRLRQHDNPTEFFAQFNGSDRLIVDYLTEEILQAQDAGRRDALLQMCVLDQMTADLVNCLTQRKDAQLLFEAFERESMFFVELDTTRTRFRFHQLFQDMLRYRLRAADPSKEIELLGLAASWHLEHGEVHQAVEYLLRAKDWDRAVEVVATRVVDVYERGEMLTVLRWIEEIPDSQQSNSPDIGLMLGILWGMEGQIARAEDILNRLLLDPRATLGHRKVAASYLSTRVYFAARPDHSIAAAERAIRILREDDGSPTPNLISVTDPRLLETLSLVSGARAHFLAGDSDEASRWVVRAIDSDGISHPLQYVGALGTRALVAAWAGRTTEARLAAHEALSIARDVGALFHSVVADAYLALAVVASEEGNPRDAALSLHEGTVRATSDRRDQLLWIARLQAAELRTSSGSEVDLPALLEELAAQATTPPPPIVANRLLALRARLLRFAAAPEAAARELARSDRSDPSVLFESVAAALTLGQNDRARALLAVWTRTVDTVPLENVQHLLLRAWLAANEEDRARSQLRLLEAFDIAQPECLVEVFIRGGSPVLALVASQTGSHDTFRRAILDRAREARIPLPATNLLDPLTDRELQILAYLPSRYKNSELADLCFVSLSTMKTHLANIYRKLDSTTRDDAIARAQQLGLL